MQIIIIKMAMKATTPPTIPIISVSSLFKVDWPAGGVFVLAFSVVGIDQMISGSVVFGLRRVPLVKIDVEG